MFVGLGKMGGNLALQAAEKGIRVVGLAREAKPELARQGVRVVEGPEALDASLLRLAAMDFLPPEDPAPSCHHRGRPRGARPRRLPLSLAGRGRPAPR